MHEVSYSVLHSSGPCPLHTCRCKVKLPFNQTLNKADLYKGGVALEDGVPDGALTKSDLAHLGKVLLALKSKSMSIRAFLAMLLICKPAFLEQEWTGWCTWSDSSQPKRGMHCCRVTEDNCFDRKSLIWLSHDDFVTMCACEISETMQCIQLWQSIVDCVCCWCQVPSIVVKCCCEVLSWWRVPSTPSQVMLSSAILVIGDSSILTSLWLQSNTGSLLSVSISSSFDNDQIIYCLQNIHV